MEATLVQSKAVKNVQAYFDTHDAKYVAEDAVYTDMTTGEKIMGRQGVSNFLHYLYHVAFDAKAIINNVIITEEKAVLEVNFVGKHTGEFAGIPPTGKEVNVPICVTYDLNNEGLIQSARIYMLTDIMMRQLKSN